MPSDLQWENWRLKYDRHCHIFCRNNADRSDCIGLVLVANISDQINALACHVKRARLLTACPHGSKKILALN